MRRLQTKVGRLQTKGQGIGTLVHSLGSMNLSPMILHNGIKIKRPAHLSIVERLGGFWCCKGKAFIWIVQGFWKKSVEMEAIFNSCWVLEIQNKVSTNQSG